MVHQPDSAAVTVVLSRDAGRSAMVSVWAAGLLLPVGWLVGQCVGAVLKSVNPDHVDVHNGLAYLGPILVSAGSAMVVLWLVSLVTGVFALRGGHASVARLGLGLLAAVTVLLVVAAIVSRLAPN